MEMRIKRLVGYTLLELLVVITLFIILGAIGIGGYLGTRETMIARETVETIKQDIRTARLKAMLLEKGEDSNWIYGIGMDFASLSSTGTSGPFFKWCSPFEDFGNEVTKSEILGSDPKSKIGVPININDVLGVSTSGENLALIIDPVFPDPGYPYPQHCTSCIFSKTCKENSCISPSCCRCQYYYSTSCTYEDECCYCLQPVKVSTYCPKTEKCCQCAYIKESDNCDTNDKCCKTIVSTDPVTEPEDPVLETTFYNGYVAQNITSSCEDETSSLVALNDLPSGIVSEFDNITFSGARYLVFEAVTGRAFLYEQDGSPINYDENGDFDETKVLDIVIKRDYSSKFDVLTIYPLSGTVIHHVYTESDPKCGGSETNCVDVNGVKYVRYGIDDEINSYR